MSGSHADRLATRRTRRFMARPQRATKDGRDRLPVECVVRATEQLAILECDIGVSLNERVTTKASHEVRIGEVVLTYRSM